MENHSRPKIGITLGDVAGVGPELVVKGWRTLVQQCEPVVLGSSSVLERERKRAGIDELHIQPIDRVEQAAATPTQIPCLEASGVEVGSLELGMVHAEAGQAAYDYLVRAIELAMDGQLDAIVTLPLNKEGLHAAGLHYPGHTEILAEKTNTRQFAMMLYRQGLGVAHVTLHMALRDVFAHINQERIVATIELTDRMMRRLKEREVRIAVAALNPHASDGGLFGTEERDIIRPAVQRALSLGINATGPLPADMLFQRASQGEFDGVVAMYHDQGHIALKLLGWQQAVNITVGLPIVRTSVAHGTAYDIAGKGVADPTSLWEAAAVAVKLCCHQN